MGSRHHANAGAAGTFRWQSSGTPDGNARIGIQLFRQPHFRSGIRKNPSHSAVDRIPATSDTLPRGRVERAHGGADPAGGSLSPQDVHRSQARRGARVPISRAVSGLSKGPREGGAYAGRIRKPVPSVRLRAGKCRRNRCGDGSLAGGTSLGGGNSIGSQGGKWAAQQRPEADTLAVDGTLADLATRSQPVACLLAGTRTVADGSRRGH